MSTKLDIPFQCMECGRRYLTVESATKAQRKGCKCGGHDIDQQPGGAK